MFFIIFEFEKTPNFTPSELNMLPALKGLQVVLYFRNESGFMRPAVALIPFLKKLVKKLV